MDDTLLSTFDSRQFENLAAANGKRYWRASVLMSSLGYVDFQSFRKAINRAMAACATLDIPVHENFESIRNADGCDDFKLSRFACYLTAMNGDTRKPAVAAAQAYFATAAESVRRHLEESENVERVVLRGEMSERERSLSGAAKQAGVEQYAFFQNAGYRGMYNMNLADLKRYKGVNPDRTPLDFMGKTELAGNLFRITQTEEKIRHEKIRGQVPLETAANTVGKHVRQAMIDISGREPESLPPAEDIKAVQSGIKKTHRRFTKMDRKLLPSADASED